MRKSVAILLTSVAVTLSIAGCGKTAAEPEVKESDSINEVQTEDLGAVDEKEDIEKEETVSDDAPDHPTHRVMNYTIDSNVVPSGDYHMEQEITYNSDETYTVSWTKSEDETSYDYTAVFAENNDIIHWEVEQFDAEHPDGFTQINMDFQADICVNYEGHDEIFGDEESQDLVADGMVKLDANGRLIEAAGMQYYFGYDQLLSTIFDSGSFYDFGINGRDKTISYDENRTITKAETIVDFYNTETRKNDKRLEELWYKVSTYNDKNLLESISLFTPHTPSSEELFVEPITMDKLEETEEKVLGLLDSPQKGKYWTQFRFEYDSKGNLTGIWCERMDGEPDDCLISFTY